MYLLQIGLAAAKAEVAKVTGFLRDLSNTKYEKRKPGGDPLDVSSLIQQSMINTDTFSPRNPPKPWSMIASLINSICRCVLENITSSKSVLKIGNVSE
jgi:hypothetical protein